MLSWKLSPSPSSPNWWCPMDLLQNLQLRGQGLHTSWKATSFWLPQLLKDVLVPLDLLWSKISPCTSTRLHHMWRELAVRPTRMLLMTMAIMVKQCNVFHYLIFYCRRTGDQAERSSSILVSARTWWWICHNPASCCPGFACCPVYQCQFRATLLNLWHIVSE